MPLGMLGYKVGMTQVYDDKGKIAPVTVLRVGPCPVLQVKAKGEKQHGADRSGTGDGYYAVQVGFLDKPRRKATRPERGHVAAGFVSNRRAARQQAGVPIPPKADVEPQRYIHEFRLDGPAEQAVGNVLTAAEVFKDVPRVDVIGTSKGRGFTGAMKRHNFGGLRGSHGVKKGNRQHGSVASNASNRGSGRPKKGIRMAGRHGASQVTVRNLDVVRIDTENHLVLVRGAVPGPPNGLVIIRPTNKRK